MAKVLLNGYRVFGVEVIPGVVGGVGKPDLTTWSIANPAIAEILSPGSTVLLGAGKSVMVRGKAVGSTTLTATNAARAGTLTIDVVANPDSLVITPRDALALGCPVGGTLQLFAQPYLDGVPLPPGPEQGITWLSGTPALASVAPLGGAASGPRALVSGLGAGDVDIVAGLGTATDLVIVTVLDLPTTVTIRSQ